MDATYVRELDWWAPTTSLYRLSDDSYVAVTVDGGPNAATAGHLDDALAASDGPSVQSGMNTIVIGPTTILSCNDEGIALSMTPLHTSPPATNVQDALASAGYTVAP